MLPAFFDLDYVFGFCLANSECDAYLAVDHAHFRL